MKLVGPTNSPGSTATHSHWGQRGCSEYRDSENFKAVAWVFYGVKIAPLPLPLPVLLLSPRAAVPHGSTPTRTWASEIRCTVVL